jgi:hypothetical protein
MTLPCPACRAENTERVCRRCRADLTLLWDLEAQRQRLLADAADALRGRDGARAIELAEGVRRLRDGPDIARLTACAYLVRGQFQRALACYFQALSLREK